MITETCLNSRPVQSESVLRIGAFLWLFCLAFGFYLLAREQFTPITNSTPPAIFPRSSALQPEAEKPILLLFAHPLCPCTRASLHELDQLVTDTGDKTSVYIVFTIPNNLFGWEQSDLIQSATKISGAKVVLDPGGLESRRFGMQGSGETLLYDSNRRLVFHGGITPSRGHEGENAGRSAITDFVLNGKTSIQKTPAFGCPLL